MLRPIAALFVAALLTSCATFGSPTAEELEQERLAQEIEVGKAALAKISGAYGVVHDRLATEYLSAYLLSLAQYAERQGLVYRCVILDSEQVNAYSLPGGYVAITVGALRQIRAPGELAGVLAHELGHINKKHILENVKIEVKKDFWETLGRLIAGSRMVITGSMNQINEKIAERLFLEGYASGQEFEADAYAVELLQALGLSTRGYVELLVRLGASAGQAELENLDKTHPPLSERLARLEETNAEGREFPISAEFIAFQQQIQTLRKKP